jgi:hypothetical protein
VRAERGHADGFYLTGARFAGILINEEMGTTGLKITNAPAGGRGAIFLYDVMGRRV